MLASIVSVCGSSTRIALFDPSQRTGIAGARGNLYEPATRCPADREDAVFNRGPLVALGGADPCLQQDSAGLNCSTGRRRDAALRAGGLNGALRSPSAIAGGRWITHTLSCCPQRHPADRLVVHLFGSVRDHSGSGSNRGTCCAAVCPGARRPVGGLCRATATATGPTTQGQPPNRRKFPSSFGGHFRVWPTRPGFAKYTVGRP
jgi:hypothetical protein